MNTKGVSVYELVRMMIFLTIPIFFLFLIDPFLRDLCPMRTPENYQLFDMIGLCRGVILCILIGFIFCGSKFLKRWANLLTAFVPSAYLLIMILIYRDNLLLARSVSAQNLAMLLVPYLYRGWKLRGQSDG